MVELPADLLFDGFWPLRVREASGLGGIGGSAESMRAHVADGDGLPGGPSSCRCGRRLYLPGTDATGEATPNPRGSIQLPPGERPGAGDERPRSVIIRRLSLKQHQNPLCAVGGPGGDKASLGLAQRLWRSH